MWENCTFLLKKSQYQTLCRECHRIKTRSDLQLRDQNAIVGQPTFSNGQEQDHDDKVLGEPDV